MILQAPHKALKTICKPVIVNSDVDYIIAKMMLNIKGKSVYGIAAPQVNELVNIIYVCCSAYTGIVINPVITQKSGNLKKSREGCLSLKGHKLVNVQRDRNITIEGFKSNWEPLKLVAKNQSAFVFQHEIDHLNGITLLNYK